MEEVDAAPVEPLVGALDARDPQVGRLGVRLELHPTPVQAGVYPVLAADLVPVPRVVSGNDRGDGKTGAYTAYLTSNQESYLETTGVMVRQGHTQRIVLLTESQTWKRQRRW